MNSNPSVNRRRWLQLASLILMAALVLLSSAHSIGAPPEGMPFETISLPPEALIWSADDIGDARAFRNPHLDSAMAGLAAALEISTEEALALADAQALRLSGERAHVQIVTHAPGMSRAVQAVVDAGGEVTVIGNDATLIQGWLPIRSLEVVANHEDVYLIRRPPELVFLGDALAGSLTTEGLAALNGPAWHTAGHTGTGVKIGIIDGGFLGYTSLLGSDLPASVTVKNFVDGESDAQVDGATKHGTACAEIIHDIAPGASLYLAKIGTNLDLQQAVAWLKDTHQVDIISTSIGWYNLTPGDGTGEFANLVQSARNAGIFWATAAGNDREAHWGGLYHDPNNAGWHYYTATQNVNFFGPGDGTFYAIPSGYLLRVFLRWDDWTNVNQDYDLYLLRWSGSTWEIIASGTNWQNGQPGQTPTEVAAAVSSGAATAYGFAIKRYSSNQVVNFEVFAPRVARLDKLLHARSLANLADAPAAVTVAALDVVSPYPQEPYSSQGPTNGPGGAETGGVIKPDIAAFANVSTVSYGTENKFNGTSAATPHVAGAAALVLSANPAYTPQQVQAFLEGRAVDMGPSGKDTIYGYGRLHLGSPSTAPLPEGSKAYLPLVMQNYPLIPATPVLNAISNDDGDGNYTVSWGAAAHAETYTLQEATNSNFSNAITVYSGANTSRAISGRDVGTYYYRVRASNAQADSSWSNTRSVVVTVPLPPCEQHDFGATNVYYYIYSSGRSWNFTAQSNMPVREVETKSNLASSAPVTFYIQVRINGVTVASWSQYVNHSQFIAYYHSADVAFDLVAGDTITYRISSNTGSPIAGLRGINYVKLCR